MVENMVKKHRLAAGLTQTQLAERAGLPISTVSDIEHGAEPRVVTALLLARALHTTVERLWPV